MSTVLCSGFEVRSGAHRRCAYVLAVALGVAWWSCPADAQAVQSGPLLVPGAMASQPASTQPMRVAAVDNNIRNASIILANLKETFASGSVTAGNQGGMPDSRMGILALLVTEKIPYTISKRVEDPKAREAALAQLKISGDFIDNELIPAYNSAKASGKPEDAKALVSLMDKLDTQLAKLRETLPKAPARGDPASPAASPPPTMTYTPSGAAGRPAPAPLPASSPEVADSWTLYVRQFIAERNLDDAQQQQAWSILKELRGRRQEYLTSHKADYEAAGRPNDPKQRTADLQALHKPVNDMFEELKARLTNVLTEAQRGSATPARPARAGVGTQPAAK